jgi:ketosteroid isomerase-like protein
MRAISLLLAVCFCVVPLADGHAQGGPTPVGWQLYRLEEQWTKALVKRDAAFFRRNLHADYVYTDERGTFTKDQVIAEQVGGSDTVTYATNDSMHAHVHGSAGVVTGLLIVRGRGKDGKFERRYRYTDTFLRDQDRWVMIASQDYEIPRR